MSLVIGENDRKFHVHVMKQSFLYYLPSKGSAGFKVKNEQVGNDLLTEHYADATLALLTRFYNESGWAKVSVTKNSASGGPPFAVYASAQS